MSANSTLWTRGCTELRRGVCGGESRGFHPQASHRSQGAERDQGLAGPNRGKWSVFSRQNGRNYRGKPGTPLDHRRLDQDGPAFLYLKFAISSLNFEIYNFKIPVISASYLTVTPANRATAPSVVCAAFSPSRKSASENVANTSVAWCQCGSQPAPIWLPLSFSRTLTLAINS
jgi:hypothetical protein